jgi:hypothetical protein
LSSILPPFNDASTLPYNGEWAVDYSHEHTVWDSGRKTTNYRLKNYLVHNGKSGGFLIPNPSIFVDKGRLGKHFSVATVVVDNYTWPMANSTEKFCSGSAKFLPWTVRMLICAYE